MKFQRRFFNTTSDPRSQQLRFAVIRNRWLNATQIMKSVFFADFNATIWHFFSHSLFNSFTLFVIYFVSFHFVCLHVFFCVSIRHIDLTLTQSNLKWRRNIIKKCVEIEFKIKLSRWAKILFLKIYRRINWAPTNRRQHQLTLCVCAVFDDSIILIRINCEKNGFENSIIISIKWIRIFWLFWMGSLCLSLVPWKHRFASIVVAIHYCVNH